MPWETFEGLFLLFLRLWVLEGELQPPPPSKLDEEEEISLEGLDSAGEGNVVPTSLVWRRVPLQTSSRSPEESGGGFIKNEEGSKLHHQVRVMSFIPH